MTQIRLNESLGSANPIDVAEGIVSAKDWPFDRRTASEMSVEVPGRWCDYNLFFAWSSEIQAMHFTCAFDMRVPEEKRAPVSELLTLVNERMWAGHFGLWVEERLPLYRHTLLMRGMTAASNGQVEDLVDIAVGECERFYPAFQFVIWGGKSPAEAMEMALLDTVGEA